MSQRILLFEADQGFAQEVRQNFESLGVAVDVAGDGEQGIDMATAQHPDLRLRSVQTRSVPSRLLRVSAPTLVHILSQEFA